MSPEMVREMNERREWVDVEPEDLSTPDALAAQTVIEAETAKPAHKTFESWMAEDDTPLPAETRVTQLVREWAGRVTCGEHEVTWLPANDRAEIEVTLITPHGASILRKDARNWRETDIAHALGEMTADLGV